MKSKKIVVLLICSLLVSYSILEAQILKDANKLLRQGSGRLTEKDATEGIRQALVNGTGEAVKVVSNVDGYFGNPQIKIPFPEDAQVIETKLRAVGLGKQVDEVILSINRAAEDAAKEATPIFVSAIKSMTVTDAVNIVRGPNDAATSYLKRTSTNELTTKFSPVIQTSLEKVNATKYWENIITAYNKLPLVKKMNPDLTAYVTAKAIDGLFVMVAKEEDRIRKDPKARTSEILRKVFGRN